MTKNLASVKPRWHRTAIVKADMRSETIDTNAAAVQQAASTTEEGRDLEERQVPGCNSKAHYHLRWLPDSS